MADSTQAPQNMPLYELLHHLLGLSDDPENAGRLIILNGDGSFIGEATLAEKDITAVNEVLVALEMARAASAESTLPAPLTVDDKVVDEVVGQFEKLLGGEL